MTKKAFKAHSDSNFTHDEWDFENCGAFSGTSRSFEC